MYLNVCSKYAHFAIPMLFIQYFVMYHRIVFGCVCFTAIFAIVFQLHNDGQLNLNHHWLNEKVSILVLRPHSLHAPETSLPACS